jgi:hypothetical protein
VTLLSVIDAGEHYSNHTMSLTHDRVCGRTDTTGLRRRVEVPPQESGTSKLLNARKWALVDGRSVLSPVPRNGKPSAGKLCL